MSNYSHAFFKSYNGPLIICVSCVNSKKEKKLPNIMVEQLTLLLHIQEVLGSNHGPETDYPDRFFLWFSSVPPGKCQDNVFN
jgi:hypothetical protein